MSSLHVPHPRPGTSAKILVSHKDDETMSSSHGPHPRVEAHFNTKIKKGRKIHK